MADTQLGAVSGIAVRGRRELLQALARADKDTRTFFRNVEREVAEPIRRDAEALALAKVTRIGVPWSRMRTGITRKFVYVAPKKRGIKTRGPHPDKRPNLADLLSERAMEPALARHEGDIEAAYARAIDLLADRFDRG